MEKITTTLLISDDLDDHLSFTEAFAKVLPSMVVVAVLSQDKAIELLSSRKLVPDYVFLDLTSPDSDVSALLNSIRRNEDGKHITFTAYGAEEAYSGGELASISRFDKDYEFPQLVSFFEDLLNQRKH
ncbi:MAG TPA: hypothetical protein VGD40_24395 [Chryseosolibacter sp.]